MIRKIIYEIINNEKANKFYYNKTKEKIISKNKPLIYVYSKIDLDDYEINNNRYVSDIKNKLQCTSKHELYENGRCMFSLSINLLIEFINKLTYELINNQIRRYEVLRLYGYRVSSIVDDNYFTNKTNEKIIKKKANEIDNPFMTYYQSQNKYIPQTKKVYREKKKSIIKTIKAFKQNGKLNQPVYESNKYLRGIVNCIYYYQNKINLGYYNSLQDVLIDNLVGDIINYVIEKFNYSLGDKINSNNQIEDIYKNENANGYVWCINKPFDINDYNLVNLLCIKELNKERPSDTEIMIKDHNGEDVTVMLSEIDVIINEIVARRNNVKKYYTSMLNKLQNCVDLDELHNISWDYDQIEVNSNETNVTEVSLEQQPSVYGGFSSFLPQTGHL